MIYLGILLFILAAVVCVRLENRRLKVTEYSIPCRHIKREITIVMLSDLHGYSYGKGNERLAQAVCAAGPDYVISAGDMCTAGHRFCDHHPSFELMIKLCRRFKFFYGCGNHEWKLLNRYRGYEESAEGFRRELEWARQELKNDPADVRERLEPLDNRCADLPEEGIRICGLNLENKYFEKLSLQATTAEHIGELIGEPAKDRLNILIGHNPEQLEAYAAWGADIVLSGHFHGGMIATPWGRGIISPRFTLFPKYYRGLYKKDGCVMVLGAGLGNHTVHVRIFNRAEIVKIKLVPV